MGTWKDRTPKVHLCSQASGVKIHNHADHIDFDDYQTLKSDIEALGISKVIMMVEAKKKDEAIMKLKNQIAAR